MKWQIVPVLIIILVMACIFLSLRGDILYHHAGSAVAIRSESGCIPKKNICFAVLSNVMDYIPKEMRDKIDIAKVENQLDIQHFIQHIFKAIR